MHLKRSVGQILMIGIKGSVLDSDTRNHLKKISPGGVILFSRNIINRDQVCLLIKDIKETVQPHPLIAIDQEGGLVVRFFKDVAVMPGNMALGAVGSADYSSEQGKLMARELKSIGFDVNLAPVVDVVTGYDNPGITIRAFGADRERVAVLGAGFIHGTQSVGISAVAKHFPGKGTAIVDPHFDLPTINLSYEEMVRTHLYPFQKCIEADVQGIMSSHVIYEHCSKPEKIPATFSSGLINSLLRGTMKFKGVIFSDDLEMGAIRRYFPFEDAVAKTVRAGHDMLLICSDYEKQRRAYHSLVNTCKRDKAMLDKVCESVGRIDQMRKFSSTAMPSENISFEANGLELARKIAGKSITVLNGHVPLPINFVENKKILAIVPDLSKLESIEEGFEKGRNNFIQQILQKSFFVSLQTEFLSLQACHEELEKVWEYSKKADLVLAFIFNAKFIDGQRLLLEKLSAIPQKTIFVVIRNPFDIEFVSPEITTVITYGYRKVQISAALKVLKGEISAEGKLPFESRRTEC